MSEKERTTNVENSGGGLEKLHYKQELNRVLKLPSVVFFGIAYMAPITIFTTYGLVTNMTHGMLSFTYLVATLAMMFTAMSYRHMVKAYPIAGSVYTYTQQSLNPHIGFMAGWGILLDYILLPMFNYVAIGVYIHILIPEVPIVAFMAVFIILVTIVNLFGMNFTKIFNNTLIVIQLIFLVAMLLFSIKYIAGGGGLGTLTDTTAFFNSVEFASPEVGWAGIFAGASILCMSFLGFDSVTTIAEETIEPEKTIGRALLIVCFAAGGTFILTSYIMQSAWPEAWFSFNDADSGAYEYMGHVLGNVVALIFCAIFIIGATASAVASSASAVRILYGMGRDGLLPKKIFGYVNKKTKVPSINAVIIGIISMSALILDLSAAASLVNFGALLGFVMVNISVIAHYFIKGHNRSGSGIIKFLICPIIGAIICAILWLNLDGLSKILGFIWLAIGFVALAISTKFFRELPPEMHLDE